MSIELLEEMRRHIAPVLPEAFKIRFYRWYDDDLNGSGNFLLFRMSGTGGPSDWFIQYSDISLQLICDPASVKAGDELMLSIVRYLRSDEGFLSGNILNYEPLTPATGPSYFDNGRARFELVIRCLTEDQ